MMINEIDKQLPQRSNKEVNPLRKTAKGLGVFLNALSEAIQKTPKNNSGGHDSRQDQDTLDTPRGGSAARSFKLFSAKDEAAEIPLPFTLNFSGEQTRTLSLLKEARSLAADASQTKMPAAERKACMTRLETIVKELNENCHETLMYLQSGSEQPQKEDVSVASSAQAVSTFLNIEEMIVKIFELGANQSGNSKPGNESSHSSPNHETALDASNQIKELLLSEGAQKTFGRFQEIDRANIIGLLR
ncbi:MAG: hypothetical protein LBI42_10980 [Chitinispirillales bacterium]|jgi:hypothetical protein|nr:hypothetical protein [Chitinispirillales bacterium]